MHKRIKQHRVAEVMILSLAQCFQERKCYHLSRYLGKVFKESRKKTLKLVNWLELGLVVLGALLWKRVSGLPGRQASQIDQATMLNLFVKSD